VLSGEAGKRAKINHHTYEKHRTQKPQKKKKNKTKRTPGIGAGGLRGHGTTDAGQIDHQG